MTIRVTQKSMTRQYSNNYNKALSQMNDISNKILTKRKFLRASENPIGAARALSIRRNLSDNETYKSNLDSADKLLTTAESTLTKVISPQLTTVTSKINSAVNGDKSQDERDIISSQLKGIADDLVKTMNSQFADRRLYGGTNNGSAPFNYDEATGKVTYNGVDISTNVVEGKVHDNNGNLVDGYLFNNNEIGTTLDNKNTYSYFPGSNPILIDIGLGIQYNNKGEVDPTTAMDISINGAKISGCGTDEDGDSKNFIQLCYDASKALSDGDVGHARALMDKITASKSKLLVTINDLGVKQSSIEYYNGKIDVDNVELDTAQTSIEGMSLEDQAQYMTEFKTIEAAYNAILQMGANVIPTSLFDFMR